MKWTRWITRRCPNAALSKEARKEEKMRVSVTIRHSVIVIRTRWLRFLGISYKISPREVSHCTRKKRRESTPYAILSKLGLNSNAAFFCGDYLFVLHDFKVTRNQVDIISISCPKQCNMLKIPSNYHCMYGVVQLDKVTFFPSLMTTKIMQ